MVYDIYHIYLSAMVYLSALLVSITQQSSAAVCCSASLFGSEKVSEVSFVLYLLTYYLHTHESRGQELLARA